MSRDPRAGADWKAVRRQVLAEESYCHLCGGTEFVDEPRHPMSRTVDHVVPLSEDGRLLDRRNLRLAHYSCNSSKGGRRRMRSSVDAPRSEEW